MKGLLTHLRVRLSATLRDPSALLIMVGSGALTLVLWPGVLPAAGASFQSSPGEIAAPALATMLVALWLWLWPMLPATTIGGRAVGTSRSGLRLRPHLALPVSLRTRVVAEATLVILFVMIGRTPLLLLGGRVHDLLGMPGPFPGGLAVLSSFLTDSLVGAAVALPVVIGWMSSAASPPELFVRSGGAVILEMAAMWLGLMATAPRATLTGLVLAGLQLVLVDRELALPRARSQAATGAIPLTRRFRPPQRQLLRDFLVRPLPLAATLLALHVTFVIADALLDHPMRLLGGDSPGVFTLASAMVMGLALGFVAVRPMASSQAIAGIVGKPGYSTGDMLAAWSILPVRRESVLRGVYLHGLLTSTGIWLVAVATVLATLWWEHGTLAGQGRRLLTLRELILPFGAVAPCIAGMLAAAAAGRQRKAMIAAIAMVSIFHGHPILLILRTPAGIHAVILAALAAAGALPILTDLRRDRL